MHPQSGREFIAGLSSEAMLKWGVSHLLERKIFGFKHPSYLVAHNRGAPHRFRIKCQLYYYGLRALRLASSARCLVEVPADRVEVTALGIVIRRVAPPVLNVDHGPVRQQEGDDLKT